MRAAERCKEHFQGDKCRLRLGHEDDGVDYHSGAHRAWREVRDNLKPRYRVRTGRLERVAYSGGLSEKQTLGILDWLLGVFRSRGAA